MTRLLDLKLGDEIALKMYPIGSVYISVNNTNPSTLFGGTWERIADGKCLWGANSSGSDVGSEKGAGLPAVTGTVSGLTVTGGDHTHTVSAVNTMSNGVAAGSGTFGPTSITTTGTGSHTHTISGTINITGTGLYGKSTTVQPPALVVCMWKRTA